MEVRLEFRTLAFEEHDDDIRVKFMKIFYFDIPKGDLEHISEFRTEEHAIIFLDTKQHKAETKFNHLLAIGFGKLKNKISGNDTVYVHQNSGIPLIGSNYFGIVERGSNIIEVKPITTCNLNCTYCSVDNLRRNVDFVVESDYLVEEFRKVAEFKDSDILEAHIGGQGEPCMYADLVELVRGLAKIKGVSIISIDTNGMMLTEKMVDDLVEAGLNRFNLSLNAMDAELASKIADRPYDIEHVKKMAAYIASKANLIIAPVMVQGVNEDEMPKIIKFSKKIKQDHEVWIGIQNYLQYRHGKKIAKEMGWDDFFALLHKWEEEYDVNLTKMPYVFKQLPPLKRPFKRDDVVKAELVCRGRFKNEMLAAAQGRIIAIPKCDKEKGKVNVKLFRSKDNIFSGEVVGK